MSEELNKVMVADDLDGQYLTFYIGEEIYGVEIKYITEIIGINQITGIAQVPFVPNHIKGIINLRGKIVPVTDVRLKFMKEERPYDDKTCIIVLGVDDVSVGLIVDEVSDVYTVSQEDFSSIPEFTGINVSHHLKNITKTSNRVILNIDCAKFL